MAIAYYDRVEDTTTSTGNSNLTLSGTAPTGRVTFNTAFGNGGVEAKRFAYVIQSSDESEWETGIGYLSASTTLVRETVIQSSNSNSVVTFSAGTKKVFASLIGYQAERMQTQGRTLIMSRGTFLP
jgi:hypothetical protein